MRDWLKRVWYRPSPPPVSLRALSVLYGAVADARAAALRRHVVRLPVPIVVVGNISVGGTGKTPCVQWLAHCLHEMGRRPGIVSRGYRGRGPFPRLVTATDDARVCGDEPLLLAVSTAVPVAVAPDRVAAVRLLLRRHPEVDVVISDDGLQHYPMARDLEFCVVDGCRGFGNGWRLPAGPLREPSQRAARTALLWINGADPSPYGSHAIRFDLALGDAVNLASGERRPLGAFSGVAVQAIAGIGHPQRFFEALRTYGLTPRCHAFPDHHPFTTAQLDALGHGPVLMTEKDAVKCRLACRDDLWSVPVQVRLSTSAHQRVRQLLACLPQSSSLSDLP